MAGAPPGRMRLAAQFYPPRTGERGRYGRAELAFLRWVIARGVLNPPDAERPGSPWWRAVNDRLLSDKLEADLLRAGHPGDSSSRSVELWGEFLRAPSPAAWYRAHNASVIGGYLEHQHLAEAELPAERFLMNVALVRVLFSHALVALPRLALGPLSPFGRLAADPRRGTVGLFLDLRRVFPEQYPLSEISAQELVAAEGTLPHLLDYGVIAPKLPELYAFAAASLAEPRIAGLISGTSPCYAWPASLGGIWRNEQRMSIKLTAYVTRTR